MMFVNAPFRALSQSSGSLVCVASGKDYLFTGSLRQGCAWGTMKYTDKIAAWGGGKPCRSQQPFARTYWGLVRTTVRGL